MKYEHKVYIILAGYAGGFFLVLKLISIFL